jgi:hypothetical protein
MKTDWVTLGMVWVATVVLCLMAGFAVRGDAQKIVLQPAGDARYTMHVVDTAGMVFVLDTTSGEVFGTSCREKANHWTALGRCTDARAELAD